VLLVLLGLCIIYQYAFMSPPNAAYTSVSNERVTERFERPLERTTQSEEVTASVWTGGMPQPRRDRVNQLEKQRIYALLTIPIHAPAKKEVKM